MFISPKQAGQGIVTLGVAALTYVGTKKAFDTYNNYKYSPAPAAQAAQAPKPIALGTYQTVALRVITAASAIMFANYIGLISLNLAARFSTLFSASEAVQETADRVDAVVTGQTPVANDVPFDLVENKDFVAEVFEESETE